MLSRKSKKNSKRGAMIPRSRDYGLTSTIQELWMPIFPARTTARLRYSTNISLSSASGVVTSYVFSANGLFDPDVTGTGHQPMGFDQMMLSYNHYTVKRAKITVTFKNNIASVPTCCITLSPSGTPITVIDTILEFGGVQYTTLTAKGVANSVQTLNLSCNIGKIQGVKNVEDDPSLQGTAAANPAEQTYFIVQIWDSSGTTGGVLADVQIEYMSLFTEPRVLPASTITMLHDVVCEVASSSPSLRGNLGSTLVGPTDDYVGVRMWNQGLQPPGGLECKDVYPTPSRQSGANMAKTNVVTSRVTHC